MEPKRTQWYIGTPNGVVICLNGFQNRTFHGVLYHSYAEEGTPFENAEQMVLAMEKLYNWLNFPHPGTNERSFAEQPNTRERMTERKKIMSDDSLLKRHGDLGSFVVRVQHRQNSSWQGRITWMEEDKTLYFRSVWEMIKLIESAVDASSAPEDEEEKEASWFD